MYKIYFDLMCYPLPSSSSLQDRPIYLPSNLVSFPIIVMISPLYPVSRDHVDMTVGLSIES